MDILRRVPHYDTAPSISSVDAADLTAESFAREYVARMRPCVVRGAVRHWPATERWRSLDYVQKKIGNPTVRVTTQPLVEPPTHPLNPPLLEMPFDQFAAEVTSGSRGHFVLHSYRLAGKARLAALGEDVLGFPYVPNPTPPRAYPAKRAFAFRDSYTDWHYHGVDETLMSQVKGSKEVLLLPPDRSSFALMDEIGKTAFKLWDVDEKAFPSWKNLAPYRVRLEEGDSLYIPTYWWHAVESVDASFGWTVAWCWGSPGHLFDPRLAGVRDSLKRAFFTRNMPQAVGAAAWSLLRRFGQPPYAV